LGGLAPSHLPDLLPPPIRRTGGRPQSGSLRRGGSSVWGSSLPWGGSGGGVLPPSLPSSSDCPPVFRVGVLVTANMCMGLAGGWGSSSFSRAVEPRERECERERKLFPC
uniref:Uncharacterized protein n=1 Tax=Mus spicilegus TaxID=10103 RepID=A0A8C6GST2_MUSSI